MFLSFAILLFVSFVALASPTPMEKRQAITAVPAEQIAAFKPFTFYAAAAYCPPTKTSTWNCGKLCQANPSFKVVKAGGDGDAVQFWYVGYDPTLKTVIVAHQGGLFHPHAAVTDVLAIPVKPKAALFPGMPSAVRIHLGFRDEHEKTATGILAAVKETLSNNTANQVTVIGHSMGGALALLDGAYFRLQLPSDTNIRVISYNSPRVGNTDFANFVDSHVPLSRITNKKDVVPIVPGRGMGYSHPNGELHIKEDNTWVSCPGHDNPDKQCSVGDAPNVSVAIDSEPADHVGPFDGVQILGNSGCV
ncbi:lipase class 3 family protein [Marasmius fiardii PR-910]|nr:lipase class 3 family protein [Marasmius fiardii PR-910]